MKTLTDLQKRAIFRDLANKSQYQVGLDYGFDKHLDNRLKIINAVNKIHKDVKNDPEKYGVSPEMMQMVEDGMKYRREKARGVIVAEVTPIKVDENQLVLGVRSKAWKLLNAKLDHLSKNRKAFKAESLMSLAKVAGIVFDKSQIVRGEATEHIALKAKIDENITTEEAITQLLKFRERQTTDAE